MFETKNILPLLLLGLMAVTAGTLIFAHAASPIKLTKTSNVPENDDVQANDDHSDTQAGDHDDGQVGDTDDSSTAQTGAHDTADSQSGPDDDSTTGDQVGDTGDTSDAGTGMTDVATKVEQAIGI
ncbi:MAG TPA: hypothetical protein VGS11_08015 [Candidatus Bathyarchaeia archaeon]|nr:hypothetical protein [Candidatus Bathyarchaeia archaeon]